MTADLSLSAPDTALHVLARVEDVDDASGALVFEAGGSSALVLVERGRVCWATAPGLRRRLSDLLRAACVPPLASDEAEQLFLRCKIEGTRFGETLVALGRLSPSELRAALLQHTSEALAIPEAWLATPRWVVHRGEGYASDYTFLALELLRHVAAAAAGADVVDDASARLRAVVGDRQGAIFDRPGVRLIACQLAHGQTSGLRALRAAGAWAAASLGAVGDVVKYTAEIDGGQWVGWRERSHTFLARCVGRDDFSSMVRALHHHGFTAAVWSSVPFGVPPARPTAT